jgi:hypothetical protein
VTVLSPLAGLAGLTTLSLVDTGVTVLSPLAGLAGLTTLRLFHFRGSKDEVVKLTAHLPELNVYSTDT